MSRTRHLFLTLLAGALFSSSSHASTRTPNDPTGNSFETLGFLRAIVPTPSEVSCLAEADRSSQSIGPAKTLGSYLFGGYLQPLDGLRFGLFYRHLVGELYDEDWKNPGNGWAWVPNQNRSENQVVVDLSPRALVSLFGKDDAVFEAKARFIQSDLYDHRTFVIRPGILRPILRNEKPWVTLSGALEFYFPLNYAGRTVDQIWAYVGGTIHIFHSTELALNFSYSRRFWDATPEFRAATGETFTLAHSSFITGLGLIFRVGGE
jgi:hypothetical protein